MASSLNDAKPTAFFDSWWMDYFSGKFPLMMNKQIRSKSLKREKKNLDFDTNYRITFDDVEDPGWPD